MTIETPCIRLCRLEPERGLCLGCGRSGEEIAGWQGFSASRRRAIMDGLGARLATITSSGSTG